MKCKFSIRRNKDGRVVKFDDQEIPKRVLSISWIITHKDGEIEDTESIGYEYSRWSGKVYQ